jgi:hypothetical protein
MKLSQYLKPYTLYLKPYTLHRGLWDMKLSVALKKKSKKNQEKKPGAMGHEALYGTSRKGSPEVA